MYHLVLEVFLIVLANYKSIMTLHAYLSGFTFLKMNKVAREYLFIKIMTTIVVRKNLIRKVLKRLLFKS